MRRDRQLVVAGFVAAASLEVSAQPPSTPEPACAVTVPNGVVAGTSVPKAGSYGNSLLSLGPFGLWPDGTVIFKPGGPGFTTSDGRLGMKFGWTRGVPGTLRVSGRRLDAEAPPLAFETPAGYGDVGFQASYLIFPTPGCWEVTGRLGTREDASLTFVTAVAKIGDGPALRSAPAEQ
jgi:hypothetical protein